MFEHSYSNCHPWHSGFSVDANSFEETAEALHFKNMTMSLLGEDNSKWDNIKEFIHSVLPSTMKTKSMDATGGQFYLDEHF